METRLAGAWLPPTFLALALAGGCSSLPGSSEQQGTAIGGAAGAATGAAIGGSDHRLLGALLGGVIGAGGGYMIGSRRDRLEGTPSDQTAAQAAVEDAERNPAQVSDVGDASTADLNDDGFVTADEITAMSNAGLNDDEMLSRLRATGQVFELTERERSHLRAQGVSRDVLNRMEQLNT